MQVQVQVQAEPVSTDTGEGKLGAGNPLPTPAQPVPPRRPAHNLWAVLIACIYQVFPLVCPICGGQTRITPARRPPLWDGCNAQTGDGVEVAPGWTMLPDRHQSLRTISASVGKGWQQRRGQPCWTGLRLALPNNVQTEKSRANGSEQVFRQTQTEGL